MTNAGFLHRVNRAWGYAAIGFCLGLLAPVGWILIRLLLFDGQLGGGLADERIDQALYLYMGGGTSLVLASFGFLIGKASQQIHDRAVRLDELNREIAVQKEEFERRFHNLNNGLKNFHSINTHIQKTSDPQELMKLSADGLHAVLGYDRVNIFQIEADRSVLKLVASRGSGSEGLPDCELPNDERAGALFQAVTEKRSILVDDISRMPEEYQLKPPCDGYELLRSRSFIICPIVIQDQVFGLYGVDNKFSRTLLDETDVDTVKLFADQVASTLTKLNLLEGVDSLTRELSRTFRQLLPFREDYDRCNQELHLATDSTGEAIRDIAGAADVIRQSVDATSSASGEISVSIQQVSENLNQLTDFMSSSIASVSQISASVHSVQDNAVRSHQMSETVRRQAGTSAAAVKRAMQGLDGISQAVDRAITSIEALSRTGEEAGLITNVIGEITQKTNLLALNAAIIAAQAGEHGRAFAVVAEEVSSLSREAAASTDAIAGMISSMRAATGESVASIGATRTLVREGLELGAETERALQEILGSSEQAMAMAHEIRRATHEVADSISSVQKAIVQLGEMSGQISQASGEEAEGIRSIVRAIEEIKNMVNDMVTATERQKQNTAQIDRSMSQVDGMSQKIFAALEERRRESQEVVGQLERLKHTARS